MYKTPVKLQNTHADSINKNASSSKGFNEYPKSAPYDKKVRIGLQGFS